MTREEGLSVAVVLAAFAVYLLYLSMRIKSMQQHRRRNDPQNKTNRPHPNP